MSETEQRLNRLKQMVKSEDELKYEGEFFDVLRDLNKVGKGGSLPLDADVSLEDFRENYPRFFNAGVANYIWGIIDSIVE